MIKTATRFQVPDALRDLWMSTEEVSEELRMSIRTVRRKVSEGVFETTKYGKWTLVSRASVNRYLNQYRHVSR